MIPLLERRLAPSFLIIGAEKGGTTSFFHHLAQHPRIVPPREKEVCYFNKDELHARGTEWYHQQFPSAPIWSNQITFEASPAYFYYPGVAARIAAYRSDIKLIVMLRDPVDRAYSAWNMHRQLREESWDLITQRLATQPEPVRRAMLEYYETVAANDFTATVRHLLPQTGDDRVEPGLLKRGLYAPQLAEYRRHFSAHRLLVLESTRCRENLAAELDRVARFLAIEPVAWSRMNLTDAHSHRRDYAAPIPQTAAGILTDFYRQPNEELFAMLGECFDWRR